MKLKKIASLMLAGIMAVSMLTACAAPATATAPRNNGDDVVTGYWCDAICLLLARRSHP